ncbi:hypothetical protein [Nitrosomonas marina]|uniref:Uncharacterized protein n=1 Tax=Nitrosomonas marina TaxID=917 RepID=A0A1H8ITY6_9PROT|nr:hypothetical protein [Nitrosomonas marina]SEN71605.1 hypothetical protein SAMN05216325_1403 [Nitrosomonas marina]
MNHDSKSGNASVDLGITRKDSSRYLEITLAAMVIAAIAQGITGDWRLGFPCFITGFYWFATHDHDKKVVTSLAVYAFITMILIFYFEKAPEHKIDCSEADDYFCCLRDNKINTTVYNIMVVTWFFGMFVVYMNQQHRRSIRR